MVSSDFGKLDAMRHFTSGSAACCARLNVGIVTAPAARPTLAVFRNFLRCMSRSSCCVGVLTRGRTPFTAIGPIAGVGVRPRERAKTTSIARDGHAIDEDGAAMLGAADEDVVTDGDDALEHRQQVARD